MDEQGQSSKEDKHFDWAKNAENAARKAEDKVNQLKKEAQQELHSNKENFNHSDNS